MGIIKRILINSVETVGVYLAINKVIIPVAGVIERSVKKAIEDRRKEELKPASERTITVKS